MKNPSYENAPDLAGKGLGITVVGCGGAGNNTLNSLSRGRTVTAKTLAINSDAAHLLRISADRKLLIGRAETGGRGTGGNVELGRRLSEEARGSIERELRGSDVVFIVAGMGGGTGTACSAVAASAARDVGALPISIVSMPFSFERARVAQAKDYVRELIYSSESTVLLENDRIASVFPEQNIYNAFAVMDTLVSDLISNVTGALLGPSVMNISYSDLRSVMHCGKTATMVFGENSDVCSLVNSAMRRPLFQDTIRDARGALMHLCGGKRMTLEKVHAVLEQAHNAFSGCRNIILGAREDGRESDIMSLTAIVTGISADAF
jgi:cell division protein FtsZ